MLEVRDMAALFAELDLDVTNREIDGRERRSRVLDVSTRLFLRAESEQVRSGG